ncbi:MAG: ABC transporter ATP-binding protein, partial [Dermatophilaceae bacterium]
MSALSVTGLDVTLGRLAVLRGVDLEVASGEVAAVLGPSGCGKTTLLRTIAGFVRGDAGTVSVGERVVAGPALHVPPERRDVGLVPQEGALFPHLTVGENVAFGLPRRERRRSPRVAEVLDLVGLPGLADRHPDELSGGQQQRVALARALAPAPRLVLLDEPFSALDAALRESVRVQVREALERSGATAVVVTHDQDEALSIADSVAVLDDGRVLMHDSPTAVYGAPVGLGVARFVGHCVELAATVDGGVARTVLGPVVVAGEAVNGAAGVLMVRPEQFRLHPSGDHRGLSARVVGTRYFGHDALVEVTVDEAERPVEVVVRTLGALPE